MRFIIADDHALFRQGLKSLLMLEPGFEVIAEVQHSAELSLALTLHPCDILLLDLQMDRWLMDQLPELTKAHTVIVITASESVENAAQALRLGARAVVQKRFAIETLMAAIKAVAEGSVWMPAAVQAELASRGSASRELTEREIEVVRYVAVGMRNSEVAGRLSISEATVKTHLNNIFQKLRIRDRLELAHYAIRRGLVDIIDRSR